MDNVINLAVILTLP